MSLEAVCVTVSMSLERFVELRRFNFSGAYQSRLTAFTFLPFSTDAKRKTTVYDRLGATCVDSKLRSGETALAAGDYIVPQLDVYLVGKLIPNTLNILGTSGIYRYTCELYFCNVRVSVYRIVIETDEETGIDSEVRTCVYTSIPASIVTDETFISRPTDEPLDRFVVRVSENLRLYPGDDVEIVDWGNARAKFQHRVYIIQYFQPELVGILSAVVTRSPADV